MMPDYPISWDALLDAINNEENLRVFVGRYMPPSHDDPVEALALRFALTGDPAEIALLDGRGKKQQGEVIALAAAINRKLRRNPSDPGERE